MINCRSNIWSRRSRIVRRLRKRPVRITAIRNNLVAQASSDAIKSMIVDGLTVIAMVTVMLWTSASLTLYLFVMVPLTGLVWRYVGRRYRNINRTIQSSMGDVTGMVEEAVEGHREIRIYGGQSREAMRFSEAAQRNLGLNLKIATTNALSTSTIQLVAASALACTSKA